MADFLLEIGLDEVPARMLASAEAELGRRVADLLTRERLLGPAGKVTTYSTPRRLAVMVENLLARQADAEEKMTGPAWKIAFKDGQPSPAAHAFAKKAGVEIAALEKITNAKGEYVGATISKPGRTASELIVDELPKEVLSIYWPKNMYWRFGKPERFVRPVRWVVALMDTTVVPVEIAGITAGNVSRGHRVLHGEAPVLLNKPQDYVEALRRAFVLVNVEERRQTILQSLDKAAKKVAGARLRRDDGLLETLVHLTEWPTAILGDFEQEYLVLPEEVLVTVMRDHQKYFAVEGADGKILPHFLAVLNVQVDEEGYETIRYGNQKVLRARFKDARFFWDVDQKKPLTARLESLKTVTFQKKLGSYHWKTEENLSVVKKLAAAVKIAGVVFDETALLKATELAKTDLTTELVKEFTELQGIIGGLYAHAQGLGKTVSKAIYDQYTPASIEDAIPSTIEGQLLGLTDRIHTVVGMFGIGMAPTGSKDPFALRRAANAIIKILAESGLPLSIYDLLDATASEGENRELVAAFLKERVSFYLKDVKGFSYDVVNAVLAAGFDDVRDTIARAEALSAVRGSEDFTAVSAAFKRMTNILRQAEEKGLAIQANAAVALAPEAVQLAAAADALAPRVEKLREKRTYAAALSQIATLRATVDAFFEKVMVMDPDEAVRSANLALIQKVLTGFSDIADFSEIVTN